MAYSRELKLDSVIDNDKTELVFEKAQFRSKTSRAVCACDVDLSRYQIGPLIRNPIPDALQERVFQYYAYDTSDTSKQCKFIVLTKPMIMAKGGIPKIDGLYRRTDNDCMYFWLAHDLHDEGNNELFEKVFDPLDKYHTQKIMTEKNADFLHVITESGEKQKLKNLDYAKSVRWFDPEMYYAYEYDWNEMKNGKTSYRRIKIRFDVEYDAKAAPTDPKKIKTKLFLTKADGSCRDAPKQITSLDDIRKYFVKNCKVQFALEINKFWIKKQKNHKIKLFECGYTIKCREMIILDYPDRCKTRSMFAKYNTKIESDKKDVDDVKNVIHI